MKNRIKFFMAIFAVIAFVNTTFAQWVYNQDALTLTSSDGTIVLNNVSVWNGKKLTIGDNGKREDLVTLDFSDGITDGWSIYQIVGKSNNSSYDAAFDECPNLKTVITGDTVETIGERAFNKCPSLERVHIGKACVSIGWATFSDIKGPLVVTFEEGSALTTLGQYAFSSCPNMKSIDFSNCINLTTISSGAFGGCSSLETIDLSNAAKLSSIQSSAFANCTSLKTFKLPDNCEITKIFEKTFENCTALEELDLSKCTSLTTIDAKAFVGNKALKNLYFPASLTTLGWGTINKHRSLGEGASMLNVYFRSCPIQNNAKDNPFAEMFSSNNKSYTVTESDMANASVTIYVPRMQATAGTPNWNSWASDWKSLADKSGTWLSDGATPLFSLPSTPTGSTMWVTDYSKTGVEWNDAAVIVKYWDDPVQVEVTAPEFSGSFVSRECTTAVFNARVNVYNVDAAEYVSLTVSLYYDEACTQLAATKTVNVAELGKNMEIIFDNLDENMLYFANLSCVDSVGNAGEAISLGSFRTKFEESIWTYYPEKKTLEKGWHIISNVTANGTALSIAASSNEYDTELPCIDFSCGIKDDYQLVSIGNNAFRYATAITNVVLSDTVTTVGSEAFRYASSLRTFTATGPVKIGSHCFYDNDALVEANIPNVVGIGTKAFQNCSNLVTIGSDLSKLESISQEGLSNCSLLEGDFVLTNLTSVGTWLFNGSKKVSSFILGEKVNNLTVNSFNGCDSLTNVVVLGELTKIDGGAFGSHGPYNSHTSEADHLNVYMSNVPDELGNLFSGQYWSNMTTIKTEDTTIVVHIPYYSGVLENKEPTDGTREKFAGWAKEWQNVKLDTIIALGCPATAFSLPTTKAGIGEWRNDISYNTGAYVVKLRYYDDPNKEEIGLLIILK